MITMNSYNALSAAANPVMIDRFASITAQHEQADLSAKYRFIPTTRVIDVLADLRWRPVKAQEMTCRNDERRGFQKHLIRFRHAETTSLIVKDQVLPEIVLTNSHDGLASFQSMAGDMVSIAYNGTPAYTKTPRTPDSPITITDQIEMAVIMPQINTPGTLLAAEDALFIKFPEDVKTAMLDACRSKRIARKLAESKARVISWADYAEQLVYSGAFRKALKIYRRIGAMVQYRELLECLPDFERMTAKQPRMVQA